MYNNNNNNNNNKKQPTNQPTNQARAALQVPGTSSSQSPKTRHWVVDKRHCRARAGNLDNSKERKRVGEGKTVCTLYIPPSVEKITK
jgi:hypothetical protein